MDRAAAMMRPTPPTRRTRRPRGPLARGAALVLLGVASAGCVERTLKIATRPPGAVVVVNDEEVGVSPVKFSFTWYGDYDIIIRKTGYQTLKTHARIDAPWWQWPPFDLITETMVIGTLRDERELPTYELAPAETPPVDQVVQRAVELRDRAVLGGGD